MEEFIYDEDEVLESTDVSRWISSPLCESTTVTNPNNKQRIVLAIDLDETMISAQLINPHTSPSQIGVHPHLDHFHTEFTVKGQTQAMIVYLRPHLTQFLRKVSMWFDVVLFTASVPEYADVILDHIEKEVIGSKIFSSRLYREQCTEVIQYSSFSFTQQKQYVKDLRVLGKDLDSVVIIDNSPVAYEWNQGNALPISTWTHYSGNSQNCSELSQLLPFLHEVYIGKDIRKPLHEYREQFTRNEILPEENHSACVIS